MNRVTDHVYTRQSDAWKTNAGIVMDGDRVILIDPGILANDLNGLAQDVHDKEIVAGFATHFNWDHILWTPELGSVPRFASAETVRLVTDRRDRIERSLDAFEKQINDDHGLGTQWDRSLFFDLNPMDLGAGEIAGVRCDLVDASGHADGQVALVLPDHDVAFVADTLSDIETPSISEGVDHFGLYLATLDRLQGVINRVSWIVPGHGDVADRHEAQCRLDADRRYLEHLPNAVANAPADQSDEDLAKAVAAELGETRIGPGLGWDMHVSNIRLLRGVTN